MATRYWIAPSMGNWTDIANWSATAGGTGGASVPGPGDTAAFDRGTATCFINQPVTVKEILTSFPTTNSSGFQGDIVTLAPLICDEIQWCGENLFLSKSQIGNLTVLRNRIFYGVVKPSNVFFESYEAKFLKTINPNRITWTQRANSEHTFQWLPLNIPNLDTLRIHVASSHGQTTGGGQTTLTSPNQNDTQAIVILSSGDMYYAWIRYQAEGSLTWHHLPGVVKMNRRDTATNWGPIDFNAAWAGVPSVAGTPGILNIGEFVIENGTNNITITSDTEVRFTKNVTIPGDITIVQELGSKLGLSGTNNQKIFILSGTPEISLNKPSGEIELDGAMKLRSDLLRDPGEVDPRTATLLDVKVEDGATIELTGDVACRSCSLHGTCKLLSPKTLDTFACQIETTGQMDGNGVIRVHQGQFTNAGSLQSTVIINYWNDNPVDPLLQTPTGLTVAPQHQSSSLVVAWNPVAGATGYVVEVATVAMGSYTPLSQMPNTTLTYNVGEWNAERFFRVKSVNATASSPLSGEVSAKTPPAAPLNIQFSNVHPTGATATITPPPGAVKHKFEIRKGTEEWTTVLEDGAVTSVIANLLSNTTYEIRVSSTNTIIQ